jgi:hypothetical protein
MLLVANDPSKLALCQRSEATYAEADIRAASTKLVELDGGGLLAVYELEGTVEFACFTAGQSNLDGSDAEYHVLFNGYGFGSETEYSLRECRHMWWSGDGYVFYPNAKIIIGAMTALGRWFDMD